MTRIDEACGDFIGINAVIVAQEKVRSILSAGSSLTSMMSPTTMMDNISKEFTNIRAIVRADYQAYGLFEAAFGQGSSLQKWADEKHLNLRYEHAMMAMMKESDLEGKFIGRENVPYTSSDYQNKVKSNWLKQQESNQANSKENIAIAKMIEEFIKNEREIITISVGARVFAGNLLSDNQLSRTDKNTLKQYFTQWDVRKEDYDNLELHKVLTPENSPLENVITNLCMKYQSQEYQNYQTKLERLYPSMMQIKKIVLEYGNSPRHQDLDQILYRQQTLPALYFNALTKLQKALEKAEKMSKSVAEVNDARLTAEERLGSYFAIMSVDKLLDGIEDQGSRQRAVFFELIFNYKISPPRDPIEQLQRGVYLENLLISAFPDTFKKTDNDSFEVSDNVRDIYAALGGKPKAGVHLDPKTFQPDLLNVLNNQPLGILLTAIKPVDKTFSLVEKVKAYQSLIKLVKNGRFKFNKESSLIQARLIGKRVLTVVSERIQAHSEEDDHSLLSQMTLIYDLIKSDFVTRTFSGEASIEGAYQVFITGERAPSHLPMHQEPVDTPSLFELEDISSIIIPETVVVPTSAVVSVSELPTSASVLPAVSPLPNDRGSVRPVEINNSFAERLKAGKEKLKKRIHSISPSANAKSNDGSLGNSLKESILANRRLMGYQSDSDSDSDSDMDQGKDNDTTYSKLYLMPLSEVVASDKAITNRLSQKMGYSEYRNCYVWESNILTFIGSNGALKTIQIDTGAFLKKLIEIKKNHNESPLSLSEKEVEKLIIVNIQKMVSSVAPINFSAISKKINEFQKQGLLGKERDDSDDNDSDDSWDIK